MNCSLAGSTCKQGKVEVVVIAARVTLYGKAAYQKVVIATVVTLFTNVAHQKGPESGGFAIWEPPVSKPYSQMLNPSELFADIVIEKEMLNVRGSIIQGFHAFKNLHPGHRQKEIEVAIEKGIRFLENKQQVDGLCCQIFALDSKFGRWLGQDLQAFPQE
ncbi:dammarenediol II synthase-like protein, partial [Tanacetum coccineum]